MARTYGMTARIRPGIELRTITIKLSNFGPPVVELAGSVLTGNRRVDGSSSARITTMALPPVGQQFIAEMKAMFGDWKKD